MKKEEHEKLLKASNPFIVNHTITVRQVAITNKLINVDDLQEGIIVKKPSELTSHYTIDDNEYVKVFSKSAYRLHIACLEPEAIRMYLYLIYKIDYGIDFLEISYTKYSLENKTTYKKYLKAIKDLQNASIICKTGVSNVYWVNTFFFFKGDRLKKYPNNIEEKQ